MPSRESNAVVTKKGAARARSGHPWIFRSDVAEASGEPGDIVRVVDGRGAFLGHAFYNPKSEITLRIAERQDTPIDAAWFQNRLQTALAYRDTLDLYTDAYRIMHAEADGVPGLVIDRYDDYVVLQIGSAAVERRLEWLLQALEERLSPKGILLRGDSQSRKREGLESGIRVLHGEVPDEILVREGSVNYR
ncbi:MAG: class I SAM-dependent rRNA methyltransferase, partial [Rubrobacteraceae bacterium]